MFLSILGFLVILAPLVIVHELGHFLFAKLFNIKVEAFSIGFGPRLFKRQVGETEFRVSAIPLGGYVKLLGEDREAELSPADAARALHKQAAWKRFFVFLGGPLFNFIFAIFVYMAIMVIGEPQVSSRIARVLPGSEAFVAGLRDGDEVTSVNGEPVVLFEEFLDKVAVHPQESVTLAIKREGAPSPITIQVTPNSEEGFSVYGETKPVGEIKGLFVAPRAATVGVSSAQSVAGKAGILTGDTITKFNGVAIETYEQVEKLYLALAPQGSALLELKPKEGTNVKTAQWTKPSASRGDLGVDFGLYSSELFIEKVVEGSPAEKAGLKRGDRLVSVAGVEVLSFMQLKDLIQHHGTIGKAEAVEIRWDSAGELKTLKIVPTATTMRDALLRKTTQYTVGLIPMMVLVEPQMVVERVLNPFKLFYLGTVKMITFSWRNFISIAKMFTGDVSVATLGGPIMIGKIAGESLSRGLIAFLTTMAILSIGLGVLNILPVPVLDGGHLVLLGLEVIRGKPLSLRQMEVVQQVGLSLILLLMVIVIKNDITRLPFFQ